MKFRTIIVLPDGDTWSVLDGCKTFKISDELYQKLLDEDIKVDDIEHPALEVKKTDDVANVFFLGE